MPAAGHSPLHPLFELIDATVELYLKHAIKPFLTLHEKFYSRLNHFLRSTLDANATKIPTWLTANFITYARTVLIIPCLLLLSWGHAVLPSLIVLLVDVGDFLDGVVARYWIDVRKEQEEAFMKKADKAAVASSDNDSFEVLSTGAPQRVSSWLVNHRNRTYGGFIDAVCDKAFVVPCWIYLLSTVPGTSLRTIQYLTLWCLILAEVASGSIRFRAFYTAGGVTAPSVKGLDFSSSAVKADHVGKAKQTFEMIGTALFILPFVARYLGLVLLFAAVPLAYESVRRKVKRRVIYVDGTVKTLDYKILKFWMQAKCLGSKLFVGVVGMKETDMVLNACSCLSVDEVIAEAPEKVGLNFLDDHGIDYVVCKAGKANSIVDDDVIVAKRCLAVGEGSIAQLVEAKSLHKE